MSPSLGVGPDFLVLCFSVLKIINRRARRAKPRVRFGAAIVIIGSVVGKKGVPCLSPLLLLSLPDFLKIGLPDPIFNARCHRPFLTSRRLRQ